MYRALKNEILISTSWQKNHENCRTVVKLNKHHQPNSITTSSQNPSPKPSSQSHSLILSTLGPRRRSLKLIILLLLNMRSQRLPSR
ncbi:hypothetical protein K443DRAFT_548658 [Laccaria amethystina LaAM-08-1]|uniref:Uncharacterized protein n=1 Tax=Laccaria amethystina LaAM-08-1 TaxID=1095629 RepID=A0A0C9WSK0_9AGAR|nr:hypothetical protein K443DRAFT_548658 [Laccaria amethystina LaAM-08-1]